MDVEKNLVHVQQAIAAAADRSGRDAGEVKLVAVTKTVTEETVKKAYQAGHRFFGENRVQEWQTKHPMLPEDCEWHIIGRLQTNKVKYLNQRISLIHSLDRYNLLTKLEVEGQKRNIIWPVLVQVNVARDEAKAGLKREEVRDFLEEADACQNVKVLGLMTIGALGAGSNETRGFFRQLRELKDHLKRLKFKNVSLNELSMGMSQDFEIAVEEGATIVRVGSSIFGSR